MLLAINGAGSTADRAKCCDQLGRMLNTWGFQWEALVWTQEAATLEPGNAQYVRRHEGLLAQMRSPGRRVFMREEPPAAGN